MSDASKLVKGAGSGLQDATQKVLNNYNKSINESIHKELNNQFASEKRNYAKSIDSRIKTQQKVMDDTSASPVVRMEAEDKIEHLKKQMEKSIMPEEAHEKTAQILENKNKQKELFENEKSRCDLFDSQYKENEKHLKELEEERKKCDERYRQAGREEKRRQEEAYRKYCSDEENTGSAVTKEEYAKMSPFEKREVLSSQITELEEKMKETSRNLSESREKANSFEMAYKDAEREYQKALNYENNIADRTEIKLAISYDGISHNKDRSAFKQFVSDMESKGVMGTAMSDKINGQYVYVTSTAYLSDIDAYAQTHKVNFSAYTDYEVQGGGNVKNEYYNNAEMQLNNYLQNGGDLSTFSYDAGKQSIKTEFEMHGAKAFAYGVQDAFMSALYQTDAGRTQRKVTYAMQDANRFILNGNVSQTFNQQYEALTKNFLQEAKLSADLQDDQIFNLSQASKDIWNNRNDNPAEYAKLQYNLARNRDKDNSNMVHAYGKGSVDVTNIAFANLNHREWIKDANGVSMTSAELFKKLEETNAGFHLKDVKSVADLEKLQIELLKKCEKSLPLNKNLKIDYRTLSRMSQGQLQLAGLTVAEANFLLTMGLAGGKEYYSFAGQMLNGSMMLFRKTAQKEDIALVQDMTMLINRSRDIYKLAKGAKNLVDIPIRNVQDKILKNRLENLTDGQKKEMAKRARELKNKNGRIVPKKDHENKIQKNRRKRLEKKNAKRQKRINWFNNTRYGKIYNKFNAKYLNFRKGLMDSRLGKFVGRLFNKFNMIKVKLYAILGAIAGLILKILFGLMMIFIVIIVISDFFNRKDPMDTVMGKIMTRLETVEQHWIDNISDEEVLEENKEDMKYGENYLSLEEYAQEEMDGATAVREGDTLNLYINPWQLQGFTPIDRWRDGEGAEKKIDEYDGGNSVSVLPAEGSDHTSNIKDILCMTDTLFQFDIEQGAEDGNIQKLTDTPFKFNFKNFWTKVKEDNAIAKIKRAGVLFSKVASGETLSNAYEEIMSGFGSTVSYKTVLQYAEFLYECSHQEVFDLEVQVFPIGSSVENDDNADPSDVTSGEASGDDNGTRNVVSECPKMAKGETCADYEGFKTYYSSNGRRVGLLGNYDGEVNTSLMDVTDITDHANIEYCIPANNDAETIVGGADDDGYVADWLGTCWTKTEGETVTHEGTCDYEDGDVEYSIESIPLDTYTCTIEKTIYSNFQDAVECTCNPCECDPCNCATSPAKYDTKTITYTWSCNPSNNLHYAKYCGGHIKTETKGIVYSFTESQINAVADKPTFEGEIIPKVEDVDYTSATTAKNDGLNIDMSYGIWCSGEIKHSFFGTKNHVSVINPDFTENIENGEVNDIFDVDMNINYARSQFPIGSYKQFESWTEDNMTIALLKYVQDWEDIYGFDVYNNLGAGSLNDTEMKGLIELINEHYDNSLSERRLNAIQLALEAVGAGAYDQDHHYHAYTWGDPSCHITDCSGFCSYIFLSTGSPNLAGVTNTTGFQGMGTPWTGNGTNEGNAVAGDALMHYGGGSGHGGNHVLLYIGMIDEDYTLSTGFTIPAGHIITVDCTTLNKGGNIYLRNYGDASVTGYSSSSYLQSNDGKVWCAKLE